MPDTPKKRYDADGIEMVADKKEIFGYAAAAPGQNCLSQLISNSNYFYTEKVGMQAGSIGTIQSVAIIGDAISDIIFGKILDRTNTKEGKCRPWLKRMIFPLFLAMMMLVCVPPVGAAGQTVWAIISQMFARAVVITVISLSLTAMINYMTQSTVERGQFGTMSAVFSNISGCVVNMLLIPMTNLLGGDQRAWIIFTAIMGCVAMLLVFITYKTTKERYKNANVASAGIEKDEDAEVSLLQSLKILVHNKCWLLMVGASLCVMIFYVLQGGAEAYYCKYILGNDNLVIYVNLCALAFMVLAFFTAPWFVKHFKMRTVALIGLAIACICNLIRIIFPYNFWSFCIGFGVELYGVNLFGSVQYPMIMSTTEVNDYNYHHRLAGMTSSANSFAIKIGAAVGSMILSQVLVLSGYDATAQIQSATAKFGLAALNMHLHIVVLGIAAVFIVFYNLEKKYPELVKANNERRAKKAAEAQQ